MEKAEYEKTLRRAVESPEVENIVVEYLAAKAKAAVLRTEVNKIEAEVLTQIPLYSDLVLPESGRRIGDGSRITQGKYTYQSGDEVSIARYYAECDRLEREAKLKPATMSDDHCPALVAEYDRTKVEWRLIEATGGPVGVTNEDLLCDPEGKGIERRQAWIDLIVGAVLARPGNSEKLGSKAKLLLRDGG